jgi:hypothetical protein
MFDPSQGIGRRFIILAHSNQPFFKKIIGRWDELLKPHYLTPIISPPLGYGWIYHLFSR